ncbi:hypothetical protein Pcinc_033798 [Petrolisthes cinctipes]|uniref:Uncharacterized protein n=1 Tax=Petrolisthes cinctipes TaxID=88211 RepID=A0AAE1JWS0_PETCI|nr:hypothetical protein Pcinc_033798 [Petrolisthes cinctipes]
MSEGAISQVIEEAKGQVSERGIARLHHNINTTMTSHHTNITHARPITTTSHGNTAASSHPSPLQHHHITSPHTLTPHTRTHTLAPDPVLEY